MCAHVILFENSVSICSILSPGLHLHQVKVHERMLEGLAHIEQCDSYQINEASIPMAPTIFALKDKRSPAKLLKEIKVPMPTRLIRHRTQS